MPTLYTESDFTVGRLDNKTITIGTNYGLSITNFSDQGFQALVQRTGETYVMPPYSLYTFPVHPNDSVIIQHLTANYDASKIGDRYLRYDQVSNTVEPKLIPLSSFPVYNQEITGNVSVLGGTVDANITSGTINASITNATLDANIMNNYLRQSGGVQLVHKSISVSNYQANVKYRLLSEMFSETYFINKIMVVIYSHNNINYLANSYAEAWVVNHPAQTPAVYVPITGINIHQTSSGQNSPLYFTPIPLYPMDEVAIFVVPNVDVASDTVDVTVYGIMDNAQNGVQTAGAGIYALANNAYTTIFTASDPAIVRGLYIGTGSATLNQFRIDKNGNVGTPFLSLNTTTVSQYYPINPGYFLKAGETLRAYQATGSSLTANITIFYT